MTDLSLSIQALLDARRTGDKLSELPAAGRPASQEEAYAIQFGVAEALGPVVAWKVGGAQPSCAPIHRETVFFETEMLPAAMFSMIGIEAEIGFRFTHDLPVRPAPWTRTEVLEAIGSVHPIFEICDSRFEAWGCADALSHFADQANHGALVVGDSCPGWRSLDLAKQRVILEIDGETKVDVEGGNAAGDPLDLLVWLANVGAKPYGGLRAGDIVTSGSCTGTIFVEPGSRSVATMPGLGRIALTVA